MELDSQCIMHVSKGDRKYQMFGESNSASALNEPYFTYADFT